MNKNYKIKKQIKFIGAIVVLALNGFVLGNINNSVYTKKASGANLVLALKMNNKRKMGQNNLDRNQISFLDDEEDEDNDNVDFSFVSNNNNSVFNNRMGQNNLDRNQNNFVFDEENGNQKQK